MSQHKINVEILDRRRKSGFFSDSYYATVRILDEGWTRGNRKVAELEVSVENYWDMEVGSKGRIVVYQQPDGRFTSRP
jgi:hypothetical protein